MKTKKPLATVRPPATVAMILGMPKSGPPTMPERGAAVNGAAHDGSQDFQDDSEKFREAIRRRQETPFQQTHWHCKEA